MASVDLREAGIVIRTELGEQIAAATRGTSGVLALSGGVDSASLALTAAMIEPRPALRAVSFRLEDRIPYDFEKAAEVAHEAGVPFSPVILPRDPRRTLGAIFGLIKAGFRGKAAIECGWPFWFVLQAMSRGEVLVTGSAADGHYGLSKKAMINHRFPKEKFDAYRRAYFAEPDRAQVASLARLAESFGLRAVAPYMASEKIRSLMLGFGWAELNSPRQKEIVREAFGARMAALRLRRHQNLQLGDSGIAEHVSAVAMRETGSSSPVAAYNELARRRGAEKGQNDDECRGERCS